MLRRTLPQGLAIVFALMAAYFSFNLLVKHIRGASGLSWFEATCEAGGSESGGANCDAVLATPFSYLPPKYEGDPPDKYVFGGIGFQFPAAFLGMVYYSGLALWFVGIGRPARSRRWVLLTPMIVISLGLLSSAFFTYLMFFTDLEQWCPWCMVTHVLNVFIAVCLVFMWPRATEEEKDSDPDEVAEHHPPQGQWSQHPSSRLVLMTVLAILLVAFGQLQLMGRSILSKNAKAIEGQYKRLLAEVRSIQKDGAKLVRQWKSAEAHEIPIRADDPIWRSPESKHAPMTVVVFSDMECPACKSFCHFLHDKVQPLFDNNLAIVFRHYPLDPRCNPYVSKKVHPHACYGTRLAEAARILSGNDGFWKVHDYLYDNSARLRRAQVTPDEIAELLQVDLPTLRETMESEAITARIKEDCDKANELELRGTPAAYISGRPVGLLHSREINFWDKMADLYWASIKVPRPESTVLYRPEDAAAAPQLPEEATPDNPGRPAGP